MPTYVHETLADAVKAMINNKQRELSAAGKPWSLYEIEKMTGVCHSMLYRFTLGDRDMTLDTADRILTGLGFRVTIKPTEKCKA